MSSFGECDFEDCPYLKDCACTYHSIACLMDSKEYQQLQNWAKQRSVG